MATDSEYRLDLFNRAERALTNKGISKTGHALIIDPRPGADTGICLVHNNADPVGPQGKPGKDKGFGFPGGVFGFYFEVFDPVKGLWLTVNEKGDPFSDAWLAVQGYTAYALEKEALDITSNPLNKAIRRYECGTELTLEIVDEQGKEKTLKIKPVREETLAEAVRREVLGETGLSIEIVTMPDKRDFVFAEEKPAKENNGTHFYKYTVLAFVTKTSTVKVTETTETDEWIWARLNQPLHHAFNQCKNKDSFIYFSHNVNFIKSRDRMDALLKYADNEQAFYSRIPRIEIHESWRYCFEVCDYRISGGQNRNKYPTYTEDGKVIPEPSYACGLTEDGEVVPKPSRGLKVRAWHIIMEALKKSDLDKATPTFIEKLFAPLKGGVSAYLGEVEHNDILRTIPSLSQEGDAKPAMPSVAEPLTVSPSPEGEAKSDDDTLKYSYRDLEAEDRAEKESWNKFFAVK